MTRDDIIRMAREAGSIDSENVIETVYAAFAAAEREACAKVCEARVMGDNNREDQEAKRCAAAIRARGQE
jgi:hypothetical protein